MLLVTWVPRRCPGWDQAACTPFNEQLPRSISRFISSSTCLLLGSPLTEQVVSQQ